MKTKSLFYIIAAGVCWGTTGIFSPFLGSYGFNGFQLTAMRGIFAFLSVALYALIFNRKAFRVKPRELLSIFFVGLALFFTSALYFCAIDLSSVPTAVMLMYTAPVLVMFFSVLFLHEKLSAQKIFAVIFMLVGCAFVSGVIGGLEFNIWGILLGLGAGVSYAAYNIITKVSMEHSYDPLSMVLYGFLTVGVVSLFVSKPWEIVEYTAKAPLIILPAFVGLGLITMALPYFLYTLGIRALPAGTASALGIVEPMSATLFSIVIFNEPYDIFSIFGIILILLAVVMLSLTERKKEKNQ